MLRKTGAKSSPSSPKPRRKRGSTARAPHPRPAGVLIGFESEDDWFEYRLEHHPEFLRRIREARTSLASGKGVRLEKIAE